VKSLYEVWLPETVSYIFMHLHGSKFWMLKEKNWNNGDGRKFVSSKWSQGTE